MGFSSLSFTANLMPKWPEFRFPTTILCRWPRLPRSDGKSQAAADDRGYNSLSAIPLASRSARDWHDCSIHPRKGRSQPSSILTLICNLLIASPFAPKKFLKQFTAFLGEHAAVDIAAMI